MREPRRPDPKGSLPNRFDGRCLHELVEQQANENPHKLALRIADRSCTFAALNAEANRLANFLTLSGWGMHSRIGICLGCSFSIVSALLAVLKIGGIYIPLDPEFPSARKLFMVVDSRMEVLLSEACLLSSNTELPVNSLDLVSLEPALAKSADTNPHVEELTSTAAAYIIYTSGSTGRPKGVLGNHQAMVNRLKWMSELFPFEESEVCCARASLSFVDSISEILGPLVMGIPLVLMPKMDLAAFMRSVTSYGITRLVVVPSLIRMMLDKCLNREADLPTLRYWVCSGDQLHNRLAEDLSALAGKCATILNLYGSSEDAGDVTYYQYRSGETGSTVPIGRPAPNVRIYVLDEAMRPVPPGVAGEIWVGGIQVAVGYINEPALTAAKFVADPFESGGAQRLFRTGDMGRQLRDGNLAFLGRCDDRLKLAGVLIEPIEIESCVAQYNDLRDAIAVVVSDSQKSEVLCLCYTTYSHQQGECELRQLLCAMLPDYMQPSQFVLMNSLPLSPNGKVSRQKVAEEASVRIRS